jgi:hypothetical protein
MKTPDKQRKATERERMKKKGFKRFECYVHPEDWPQVRKYMDRLNKRRADSAERNGNEPHA